ncbi:DUF433 domain-containing protein [Staphylococcus aureus]|uniref:DUF433 domain-containing protein n=1 Tax=Staphylococcus aureus TaxID=1280 RepID=UPI00132F6F5E
MKYQDRITRDPQVAGGEPIIKGTRVRLRMILASLAKAKTKIIITLSLPPTNRQRSQRSARPKSLPLRRHSEYPSRVNPSRINASRP